MKGGRAFRTALPLPFSGASESGKLCLVRVGVVVSDPGGAGRQGAEDFFKARLALVELAGRGQQHGDDLMNRQGTRFEHGRVFADLYQAVQRQRRLAGGR